MTPKDIKIRISKVEDFDDIMELQEEAFGRNQEAKLVADILNDKTAEPTLSLIAYYKNMAVGHVLFSRVYIGEVSEQALLHILAPIAIDPEYQKQGIGTILINEGLKQLKAMGSEMVFVLGDTDFYAKCGFVPNAKAIGYAAPYTIPEDLSDMWMVQALNPLGFTSNKGKIICCDELNQPKLWRE